MDLTCYTLEGHPVELRPAEPRRDWMDQTPSSFAYRCLPLTMANSHGWEILSPVAFTARWNGGTDSSDLEIAIADGNAGAVASHFGSGILTFVPNVVLRSPTGTNLFTTGPVNRFKDGIQALSALIESDWMPYTFTMNWKMTRPGQEISFAVGEPYCFFFPVSRGLVESCEPRFAPIVSEQELTRSFECAYGRRLAVHQATEEPAAAHQELRREANWYMRGITPDGACPFAEHQTRIRPRTFGSR
jgi:hypothetical protein